MIFARSRRSILVIGVPALAAALTFGSGAAGFVLAGGELSGALVFAILALLASGVTAWAAWRLRGWPPARLGFFRDRLVVVQRKSELRAPWDLMEIVTLAAQREWDMGRWPEISLTDRLTIQLRREAPLTFRPASFGLDPVACRDLILRLRDDRRLRARLPEFDSALDLATRPVFSGELITPPL